MSGMLTVVGNPRQSRRTKRHRARARRRGKKLRRARTRHVLGVHRNPARRTRRRRVHARRRSNPRRRRHHNPILSGGVLGPVMKGITLGIGAVAARAAANAVKNTFFKDPAAPISPVVKIGLEAGVGVVGYIALGKLLKQRGLANAFAVGAGIVVAMDLYDSFVAGMLPAILKDYSYGSLNDYQTGQLNGWAPQSGIEPGLGSANMYADGIYG
jgi:hypothetical protein